MGCRCIIIPGTFPGLIVLGDIHPVDFIICHGNPVDEDGTEIEFKSKKRNLNSKQYKKNAYNREKNRHFVSEDILHLVQQILHQVEAVRDLGEGASTVLSLMGVAISNDTIQRLYDRIEFKDDPDVGYT